MGVAAVPNKEGDSVAEQALGGGAEKAEKGPGGKVRLQAFHFVCIYT